MASRSRIANAGLVAATGVASRVIAFAIAGILAVIALQPRLLGSHNPTAEAVMAAATLFTAASIAIRWPADHLDARPRRPPHAGHRPRPCNVLRRHGPPDGICRCATVGPADRRHAAAVAATLVALGLNLLFRIGIRRRATMTIDSGAPVLGDVTAFIERAAPARGRGATSPTVSSLRFSRRWRRSSPIAAPRDQSS